MTAHRMPKNRTPAEVETAGKESAGSGRGPVRPRTVAPSQDQAGYSAAADDAVLTLPATGEKYRFEDQVGFLLRKAYQRNIAIFQELSDDAQLTSVQFAVLCALAEAGPSSPTVIGKMTAIDPATMRGIVQRLRARKLLTISPDPSDGRKLSLVLTAQGRQTIADMLGRCFEITRRTLGSLNVAEQTALIFLLKKLVEDEA